MKSIIYVVIFAFSVGLSTGDPGLAKPKWKLKSHKIHIHNRTVFSNETNTSKVEQVIYQSRQFIEEADESSLGHKYKVHRTSVDTINGTNSPQNQLCKDADDTLKEKCEYLILDKNECEHQKCNERDFAEGHNCCLF
jgi:hypothetical protein